MGSREGVRRFRRIGASQTLLAAVTECSRRLRAFTANKSAVRRRTNDRSRRGAFRSMECTRARNGGGARRLIGTRRLGRSGRGGGTGDNGRLGPVHHRQTAMHRSGLSRAIPAPVATIGRTRSTMIFRTPNGSLTGHPGRALVRTLMPPIGRAPVVAVPEIQLMLMPVKVAIQPPPEAEPRAKAQGKPAKRIDTSGFINRHINRVGFGW